ncbi:MAG: DUF1232 domain-containing protein [Lentisphaerae bacterium]|nr:DUF1232 domain-containing protein [Lentisphaerota bacterium]
MLRDWWRGNYRKLPWWCIGVLVFTLIYVLSPVDLIPDCIPVIGLLDDISLIYVLSPVDLIPDCIPVIGLLDDISLIYLCYKIIEGEIEKYNRWRNRESEIIDIKVEKA